jgi:hypothetical protein
MNNLEDRDDVVAAMMAAQIGAGLKYIDNQTTSRPFKQPPANRIDPNTFVRKHVPVAGQTPLTDSVQKQINPVDVQNLKDILIPAPTVEINKQQTVAPSNKLQQLELPISVQNLKKPQTVIEWFEHMDKKIDDLEFYLQNQINVIHNNIKMIKEQTAKRKYQRLDGSHSNSPKN